MHIIRQLPPQPPFQTPASVLTIGSYDGIHRGHKRIIAELKHAAARYGVPTAMVTFYPRPKVVLGRTEVTTDYLTTVPEKLWLLEKLGLDIVAIIPFSVEFAQTPAETFVRQLVETFHPKELWVGPNFKLGKGRAGDIPSLREMGTELGFRVNVIDEEIADGEIISSTRIRAAMAAGDVREVTRLLGAYPFLRGKVLHGAQRGRTIGFPTANIAVPPEKLLPANGVYATWIYVHGKRYPAVTNIGVRPTFDETERAVEVHIFDFSEMIYDQLVHVEWVERLRSEQKFDSVEGLMAQIRRDSARAREILAAEAEPVPGE
ncbi:MAG TPA: bifunctional riboflavin kinase/FAD synthetase [Anaerolineae bacterium]|nr:bifunctional riboflavin kinase/FAD synthetase [Anaerolineae bacterium]